MKLILILITFLFNSKSASSIEEIPECVWTSYIFPCLSLREWISLSRTNTNFNTLLNDSTLLIHRVIDELDAKSWYRHNYPDYIMCIIIHYLTENDFETHRKKLFNSIINYKHSLCKHNYHWMRNISLDSTVNLQKKFLVSTTNLLMRRKLCKGRTLAELILYKLIDRSMNNSIRITLNDIIYSLRKHEIKRNIICFDLTFYKMLFDQEYMHMFMTKQQYLLQVLNIIRNFSAILDHFQYDPCRIYVGWRAGLIESGLINEVRKMYLSVYGNANALVEFRYWALLTTCISPNFFDADGKIKPNQTKQMRPRPIPCIKQTKSCCDCIIS